MSAGMVHDPVWVCSWELGGAPPRLDRDERHQRALVLVRRGEQPLAFLEVGVGPDGAPAVAPEVLAALAEAPRLPDRPQEPGPLSVVVCTRDRPESLARTLASLALCRDQDAEIVVVDNASSDDATAHVVSGAAEVDARVRFVHEPVPGLSRARNAGARAAFGSLLAFTDDDVVVDPAWLRGIRTGFGADPTVGAVTGAVAPAELETPWQQYFDRRIATLRRVDREVYRPQDPRFGPLFPYATGRIGAGSNFGVRAEVLQELGGFDEALGAGTLTMGGEDLDLFCRALLAGSSLVYEPTALVWHHHRRSAEEAKRQMLGFGVGLGAYFAKLVLLPETRSQVLRRVPTALADFLRGRRSEWQGDGGDLVLRHQLAEARGLVLGPARYLRERHRSRATPPAPRTG